MTGLPEVNNARRRPPALMATECTGRTSQTQGLVSYVSSPIWSAAPEALNRGSYRASHGGACAPQPATTARKPFEDSSARGARPDRHPPREWPRERGRDPGQSTGAPPRKIIPPIREIPPMCRDVGGAHPPARLGA